MVAVRGGRVIWNKVQCITIQKYSGPWWSGCDTGVVRLSGWSPTGVPLYIFSFHFKVFLQNLTAKLNTINNIIHDKWLLIKSNDGSLVLLGWWRSHSLFFNNFSTREGLIFFLSQRSRIYWDFIICRTKLWHLIISKARFFSIDYQSSLTKA